jgi:cyclomaltodextrinase / maltogenic alpha-amylase / neopullulanase
MEGHRSGALDDVTKLYGFLWRSAAAALLAGGCAAPGTPLAFDTPGGEAWTFEKVIQGAVPPGACDTIAIASPLATVIARPDGGRFIARVPLAGGDNRVSAECRKGDRRVGGIAEQHWLVRIEDRPRAALRTLVTSAGLLLDAGATTLAPARPAPIVSYDWQARAGNPSALAGLPAHGKRIVLPLPDGKGGAGKDGAYYVTLRVTDAAGRSDESTAVFRMRGGRFEAVDLARDHPAWADTGVVYGVAPFFFGPRGFDDVTERLDDLAALGVTILWLSPVTESPDGDFGYAVTDHFRVRSRFGGEAALHRLIETAHARGLKVIIDFVTNHASDENAYFADAEAHGRGSPYFSFFARTDDGDPAHYFDWKNLENLNYDNPEVQRLMIAASSYWVRRFDVDGFRVDAAWGPRRRAAEFWPRWRAELKRIKPDLLLLAEASAHDPYYVRHGFDAAYDWTGNLGDWAWQKAFDDEAHTAPRLRAAITATTPSRNGLVLRFLDNNDTGERFIARYGLARTRVAAAMLLTLPGLPALYTGDEVGAAFQPYSLGPPISWGDPNGLRAWYARLLFLRRTYPALHGRSIRMLDVAPGDQVLAYIRPAADARNSVLVLLNYGAKPARVALPAPEAGPFRPGARLVGLLDGDGIRLDGRRPSIRLAGYGVRILRVDRRASDSNAGKADPLSAPGR